MEMSTSRADDEMDLSETMVKSLFLIYCLGMKYLILSEMKWNFQIKYDGRGMLPFQTE